MGHFRNLAVAATALVLTATAFAEDSKVKQEAKEAGKAVGEAAREVGHGTKKVTKEVGKTVAEAARETGHAFRDGAKELKKAVQGESDGDKQKDK